MDNDFCNPMTVEGGLLPAILEEEESYARDRRRQRSSYDNGYGDHDDESAYEGESDYSNDDEDEFDDGEAIFRVDWTDHDEIMDAVESDRFDSSDIEAMVEHAISDGVHFDADDVDEISARIGCDNLKGRLRSQI